MAPAPLDYQDLSTSAAAWAAFRRDRLVYAVGVLVTCFLEAAFCLSWPHTSNGLDPKKAELYMAMHVVGGASVAWLAVGVRRIVTSPLGRRSVAMWLLAAVNLLPAVFTIPSGYQ